MYGHVLLPYFQLQMIIVGNCPAGCTVICSVFNLVGRPLRLTVCRFCGGQHDCGFIPVLLTLSLPAMAICYGVSQFKQKLTHWGRCSNLRINVVPK